MPVSIYVPSSDSFENKENIGSQMGHTNKKNLKAYFEKKDILKEDILKKKIFWKKRYFEKRYSKKELWILVKWQQ